MSYPPPDYDPSAVSSAGAARARDRGLTRIRGLTGWIAAAAVAGTAALGAVYTHVLPGGSASPAPAGPVAHNPAAPSSSATTHRTGGDDGGEEEGDDDGGARQPALQSPAQPPTPTQQQPQTTTGAS
ncbi:hypothetical protein ABT052_18270 [Streptomyces sp. NPDC002766]|jgi:hypothetical protein|uniref:hypothetical protein n=1 Tax=unclassified Streptomyces TaxID=2593676 RepID=UPI003317BB0F